MIRTNNHTYEKSVEERFKQKHPKLSKIIEIAISWGHDFEYDLSNLKEVILWYNNQLQSHIRLAIKYGYSIDILSQPFMAEFKNGDINTITLRDYIISIIKDNPIEVAFCTPLIFRTDSIEYTMDSEFKIHKWNFSVSKCNTVLSNGKKYTDILLELLTNINARTEIITKYKINESKLNELYLFLKQLIDVGRTDWQILKELQQSSLFIDTYCEALFPYMYDKKDYLEVVEILNS